MKYLFIFFLLISGNLFAQTPINVKEAEQHIGDSVKIEAVIYGGKQLENSKGSPTFLNVGGNYPDAPLTLVIGQDVRNKFQHTDIENYYKSKKVIIFGRITTYKNKPQIVINDPAQIKEQAK